MMQRRALRDEQLAQAAPLFAALGDPVRLDIVQRLCRQGPLPTVQLRQGTRISRQAITRHLQVLEDAGLVASGRVGRDRQWKMQARQLAALSACLERISVQWDTRLERLKALVEDT
jgi:DNA-binding transcriptional ArsR family regulator